MSIEGHKDISAKSELGRVLLGRIRPYLSRCKLKSAKIDMVVNNIGLLTCEIIVTDELLRVLSGEGLDVKGEENAD